VTDWCVRAEIIRWVDDDPWPGIVECRFSDATGRTQSFVGKFYDFTDQDLSARTSYPVLGYIACEIVSRQRNDQGIEVAEVETDQIKSWRAHESVDGFSRFVVMSDQLEQRKISN